jgi:hypothetical protein
LSPWSRALKAALVNRDTEAVMTLYGEIPDRFDTLDEAQEASALIAGAIALLKEQRDELASQMGQTKAAISYQHQQGAKGHTRLDLKE